MGSLLKKARSGVLLLALFSCTSTQEASQGDSLFEEGDFSGAYSAYQRALAAAPENANLQEKVRVARNFHFLDKGRRHLFKDEFFEAQESFQAILVDEPEHAQAQKWMNKTKKEISQAKTREGFNLLAEEEYEAAIDSLELALLYTPDDDVILGGLEKIRNSLDSRLQRSEDYYLRAVRDRAANLLHRADANLNRAEKYQPADPRIRASSTEVRKQLAEEKFLEAYSLEKEGNYGAALIGYRAVHEFDRDYPGLSERIAIAEVEIKANEYLRRSKILLTRNDFDRARKALDLGRELTTVDATRKKFEERLKLVQEREVAHLYLDGRTMEQGRRFEEARVRYQDILSKVAFYQDVIQRLKMVTGIVEEAKALYEKGRAAEAEGKSEEALGHYRKIMEFYPDYRDVQERLRRED